MSENEVKSSAIAEDVAVPDPNERSNSESDHRILIVGHSHTAAVASALERTPNSRIRIVDLRTDEEGRPTGDHYTSDAIRKDFNPTHVFSMVGGNTCYRYCLLEFHDKIQVLAGINDTRIEPDRMLITNGLMSDVLQNAAEFHFDMMKELKDAFPDVKAHILPPPPYGPEEFEKYLPSKAQNVNKYGVAPAMLRLKLYRMQMRLVRDFCKKLKIPTLSPPAETLTQLGYLKYHYRGKNATHADWRYGELILKQIQEAIAPQAPDPTPAD